MELTGNYTLDASHSRIGFVTRHAMVTKVRGQFDDYSATITVDEAGKGHVEVTIDAASINTRNADRDAHVKSADFFDVENYPQITFVADFDANDLETLTGDLTIKGHTKQVTLDVEFGGLAEDPFGNVRAGFDLAGKINRLDFGIDFNAPLKTGGMLLSEEITLEIEVSAIKNA